MSATLVDETGLDVILKDIFPINTTPRIGLRAIKVETKMLQDNALATIAALANVLPDDAAIDTTDGQFGRPVYIRSHGHVASLSGAVADGVLLIFASKSWPYNGDGAPILELVAEFKGTVDYPYVDLAELRQCRHCGRLT